MGPTSYTFPYGGVMLIQPRGGFRAAGEVRVSHQRDVSRGCSRTHVQTGLPDRTTAVQGSGECTDGPTGQRHGAKI